MNPDNNVTKRIQQEILVYDYSLPSKCITFLYSSSYFAWFFLSSSYPGQTENHQIMGQVKFFVSTLILWLHYTPYKYIQGSKLRLIQLQKQLSFSVLCIKNSQSTSNIYSVSNKALRCLCSCHCGGVSNAFNRIIQKYSIVHDFKPILQNCTLMNYQIPFCIVLIRICIKGFV